MEYLIITQKHWHTGNHRNLCKSWKILRNIFIPVAIFLGACYSTSARAIFLHLCTFFYRVRRVAHIINHGCLQIATFLASGAPFTATAARNSKSITPFVQVSWRMITTSQIYKNIWPFFLNFGIKMIPSECSELASYFGMIPKFRNTWQLGMMYIMV